MEEQEKHVRKEDIFSNAVRAGKRTYFFDVKATKADQYYLTITESKRRFNADQGKFYYEKHKVFLYQEDFEKFSDGLNSAIEFICKEQTPTEKVPEVELKMEKTDSVDVSFEDLGKEEVKTVE